MLAELGIVILFMAFVASVSGVLLSLVGIYTHKAEFIASARNALLITTPLVVATSGVLIYAQLNHHYEMEYVSQVSKDAQPTMLKITALWGGQAGSLILWSLLMSVFTSAALLLNWKSEYRLMPWVMVVTGVTLAFFLLLSNFYENPFERYFANADGSVTSELFKPKGAVEAFPYQSDLQGQLFYLEKNAFIPDVPDARFDGHGLNPLLRHPGMVIHPPMLYLGFTGFVIPFAFAMAALLVGDLGLGWIRATRRWSLIAWMFLSIGLILGGRWAYDVLGWGGYWGWDPVENSSFLPWLTGTAFLHSVMIQERRGMLKGWNMVMIMLTYLLVLFGTVATRTGLLSSVHSFAQSPLSIPMGVFLTLTISVCIGLFLWRGRQGIFESDHALEGIFSRESLFLFNNWVFLAITGVVFWGTWSELITGFMRDFGLMNSVINLGPEYYKMVVPWLFMLLFILMGVAPLAAWRRASAQKLSMSLRVPIAGALITYIVLFFFDQEPLINLGFGVAAFAGFATLQEFYKGAEARHRTHGEAWHMAIIRLFGRNHRRYGGYMIHLGVVVIGIGILASTVYQEVRQQTLSPGETMDIGPYTMRYDQAAQAVADDGRSMVVADVTLFNGDKIVDTLRPRRDFFGADSSPMTIAGVHSTVSNDIYVLLSFWQDDQITFRIYRNPLINFVWWGGLLLILGTFLSAYRDPEPQTVTRSRPLAAAGHAVAGD